MSKPDDGAFPMTGEIDAYNHRILQVGLTKREYFAGLAMQELLSGYLATDEIMLDPAATIAREAVNAADTLIAELEKKV